MLISPKVSISILMALPLVLDDEDEDDDDDYSEDMKRMSWMVCTIDLIATVLTMQGKLINRIASAKINPGLWISPLSSQPSPPMGIHGLWSVLSPDALPVNEYTGLKGKRLAIDASIWLYQLSRVGDSRIDGSSRTAFVLSGIFRRLAKLIHFKILPVFVFDGLPPLIKREELKRRAGRREKAAMDLKKIAERILKTKLKLLAAGAKPSEEQKKRKFGEEDDPYRLGPKPDAASALFDIDWEVSSDEVDDDGDGEVEGWQSDTMNKDALLAQINVDSVEFRSLPEEAQHDLLLQLKDRLYLTRDPDILHKADDPIAFAQSQLQAVTRRHRISVALDRLRRQQPSGGNGLQTARPQRIASNAKRAFVLLKNESKGGYTFQPFPEKQLAITTTKQHVEEEKASRSDDDDDDAFQTAFFSPHAITCPELVAPASTIMMSERVSVERQQSETRKESPSPARMVVRPDSDGLERVTLSTDQIKTITDKSVTTPQLIINYDSMNTIIASPGPATSMFTIKDIEELRGDQGTVVENLQDQLVLLQTEQTLRSASSEGLSSDLERSFRSLLDACGFPWMVAVGEAEAQCAQLYASGAVDGIITDDVDVFLFGGDHVYRHFFRKNTMSELYRLGSSGLSRDDLIFLGLLLGGDYGPGVTGIGPKKAIALLGALKDVTLAEKIGLTRSHLLGDPCDAKLSSIVQSGSLSSTDVCSALNDRIVDAYRNPSVETIPREHLQWGRVCKDRLHSILLNDAHWKDVDISKVLDDLSSSSKV